MTDDQVNTARGDMFNAIRDLVRELTAFAKVARESFIAKLQDNEEKAHRKRPTG